MIDSFRNEYFFLSNYSCSPFYIDNVLFPTMEHYFQTSKASNQKDYLFIANAPTPGDAKRLGRRIQLRHDWEKVKDNVMLIGLRKKFANPELRDLLLATGDEELVEGNYWHDNEWGNCTCPRCKNIPGKNKLGKLLMQVREEIKNNA